MTSLVYVDWAITRACNLKCQHCVGMEQDELTHDEAVGIANDIVSLSPKWVILEGGEPLLRKDLPQIGEIFRQAGIDIFVITNGNAFNDKRLHELASFSPKVLFSFDGANAEVYEFVKRGANFETALHWDRPWILSVSRKASGGKESSFCRSSLSAMMLSPAPTTSNMRLLRKSRKKP